MTLSTRIGVMNHGEIVQVGTPSEIYEYPNSRFVTEFIGSVNLFEGIAETSAGGGVRLVTKDGLVIEAADASPIASGQTAWFALRPEKVRIAHEPPAEAGVNAVAGEVWDIAYLGDMSLYNVRLDSGKLVRASVMNAARSIERPIAWEDRVWLSFAPDAGVMLTK